MIGRHVFVTQCRRHVDAFCWVELEELAKQVESCAVIRSLVGLYMGHTVWIGVGKES